MAMLYFAQQTKLFLVLTIDIKRFEIWNFFPGYGHHLSAKLSTNFKLAEFQ